MGANQTSFEPRKSGNPAGRPPGRRALPPHDKVLGRRMLVTQGGNTRYVSADEAFLLYLLQQVMKGKSGIAENELLRDLEKAKSDRRIRERPIKIERRSIPCGVFMYTTALRHLKIVRVIDRFRTSIRFLIEPWIVQKALARLGDKQLTEAYQTEISAHVGSPNKVLWPDWWTVRPWLDKAR